jgi:hypothetical protein
MGYKFADQFSLLHLSVGVIFYFWNISLINSFILHFLFEYLENTETGIQLINKYIINPGYFHWPGEKHKPDSKLNMLGDNIFFIIGWLISYFLDIYGSRNNWYIEK